MGVKRCLLTGMCQMMNIPLHSRITGKPGRCEALRKFCEYVAAKEGVWVTTRRDIARQYREKFPYRHGSRRGGDVPDDKEKMIGIPG